MFREVGGDEDMKCMLCSRRAVSDLCTYHERAKRKVEAGYRVWINAYGKMEWKDYLDKVKRNEQTGQWAKEIAEMMEGL
jgi:hypothetical protein